jgi:hypothetical protein
VASISASVSSGGLVSSLLILHFLTFSCICFTTSWVQGKAGLLRIHCCPSCCWRAAMAEIAMMMLDGVYFCSRWTAHCSIHSLLLSHSLLRFSLCFLSQQLHTAMVGQEEPQVWVAGCT